MQRRNVDLPEPDGPTMHSTWPLPTSSVTPLRTCSAPKLLQTCSAFTIGVMRLASVLPGAPVPCALASASSCLVVSLRDAPREKYRSR